MLAMLMTLQIVMIVMHSTIQMASKELLVIQTMEGSRCVWGD